MNGKQLAMIIGGWCLAAIAVGQVLPTPPNSHQLHPTGELNFESALGSFKIVHPRGEHSEGTVTFSFDGTVLVSGLTPGSTVTVTGAVSKVLDLPRYQRLVYHGKGTMTVKGKFYGIQFFGKDVKGRWVGFGIMRVFGEFDQNLNTGTYWYDGQPKMPWGIGGMTLANPKPSYGVSVHVKIKNLAHGKGH